MTTITSRASGDTKNNKHCQRHNGPRDSITFTFIFIFPDKNLFKDGATCISYKFGHQMALLVLLVNVANSWCFLHHHLHWLQIYPSDSAICIGYNIGPRLPLLALVTSLVIQWRHLHYHIALDCPIDLLSLSARVTSVKSAKGLWDNRTHRSEWPLIKNFDVIHVLHLSHGQKLRKPWPLAASQRALLRLYRTITKPSKWCSNGNLVEGF